MGERLRIGLLVGMLLAAIPATASAATHLGVGGSVEQMYVIGAHPGERLALVNAPGRDGRDAEGRRARRDDLPRRETRAWLSGPTRGWRRRVGGGDRADRPLRAAEHEALRPTDPGLGLRLPDHPGQ